MVAPLARGGNDDVKLGRLAAIILVLVLGAGSFLAGGPRRAVDWQLMRAVVIQSDDWGFAGFAPAAEAWRGVERDSLAPGRFPDTYWDSTLEDAAAVEAMTEILAAARGRDGLPAVFQPNYILFSMDHDGTQWRRYALPALPPAYRRPGLWAAVAEARRAGVWHPELHGAWHYDPDLRIARALESPAAARATAAGITVFRDAHGARELGPWRDREVLAAELDASRAVFAELFGTEPASVIAPDYTWSARNEDIWVSRGLRIIQAKREQRDPTLPAGRAGRVVKWLDRRLAHLIRADRSYVERNCRFEPAQHGDPDQVADRCARQVFGAWAAGEPAVIETHRVNFVHLDAGVAERGRDGLAGLLQRIGAQSPGPLFLSDAEVAQLERRGVSAVVRGEAVILRNAAHSYRVAALTVDRVGGPGSPGKPLLVGLPGGSSVRLTAASGQWQAHPPDDGS